MSVEQREEGPYRSDSVMSSKVSQVSNPSAIKESRYWLRPSLARIGANAGIETVDNQKLPEPAG